MLKILPFIILLPSILFADLEKNRALFTSHTNILAQIDSVSGCCVGFGGTPGAFYTISTGLRKYGIEEDYVRMSESTNPIFKCMGIYCLANTRSDQALEIVEQHLSDSQLITYQPFGCDEYPVSVGRFCWEVLVDRDHLDDSQKITPMVPRQELSGIALEALWRDDTWHIHWKVSEYLNLLIKEGGPELLLTFLRAAAPHLEDNQLIKAVGRIEHSEPAKSLLLELAGNNHLDDISKLATASALTRFADEEMYSYITEETELLDSIPTNSASIIKNDLHEVMIHRDNMTPIKKARTISRMKLVGGEHLLIAYSTSHPVAFDDYQYRIHTATARRYEEIRKKIVDSLITMSLKKSLYSQPWNTYSDVPYRIQGMIDKYENDSHYKDLLTEEEKAQIRDALK